MTLAAVIKAHIAREVGPYKGQCYAWDVVNEAVEDTGNFRNSVFFQVMGTSYIPLAFEAAAAADPAAKLYYNDYSIEQAGAKASRAIEIVKLVQAAGARIDGVGLQGHFVVGSTPSQSALVSQLNAFTALGVEVAYTELDIRFSSLPSNASGLQQQAKDYVTVVGACMAVSKCVGVTVWDFDDKYSWIPSTFPGAGDACLFSSDLTPKPAYTAISSLLAAAGTAGASVSTGNPAATTVVATTKGPATLVASTLSTSVVSKVALTTKRASASPTAAASSGSCEKRRRVVTVS